MVEWSIDHTREKHREYSSLQTKSYLLLEADFNALNKIVFNNRTIPNLEASNSILYKVIRGRREQSLIHIALNKKLVYDISNQLKKHSVVVSADAANCYDRIAHLIASQACQHFEVQLEYLLVLFSTIQIIKMYLRTSFGLSEGFYTDSDLFSFQGGVQGNRAAPLL